jgi:hypothetical protein
MHASKPSTSVERIVAHVGQRMDGTRVGNDLSWMLVLVEGLPIGLEASIERSPGVIQILW